MALREGLSENQGWQCGVALTNNNFVDGQDGRAVVLQPKLTHTLSEAGRGSWGLSGT